MSGSTSLTSRDTQKCFQNFAKYPMERKKISLKTTDRVELHSVWLTHIPYVRCGWKHTDDLNKALSVPSI